MRIRNKTQMLFEAKFGSYKVYDEGILSLIDTNGWVTDEVRACKLYASKQAYMYICVYR